MNPRPPYEAVKKFRPREIGGPGMPGQGQIHSAKTGAGFSVAGPVFNSLEPKREPFCFYKSIPELPTSLGGSRGSASRSSIARRVLVPPRRDEFDPPPDNERGLCLPTSNFFTASPRKRGTEKKINGGDKSLTRAG